MSRQERTITSISIPKGSRNEIRVTSRVRDNRTVIDIRQFEPNGLRVLVATMKGVNVDLTALPILIAALEALKQGGQS